MSDLQRPRILIVDDQPANVRLMAEALKDEFDVRFATQGQKVAALALAGDIDLILLDVVMPDLDGFQVCQGLKSDPLTASIPIIFVTAREEVEDETRGFDVGGVDYITKPIQPAVVRARVRTHVELKRARDLLERLATTDPLTGLANRRQLEKRFPDEWRRAARNGKPLSLAILDVDFFKQYNDTYGHVRGDECLRMIASCLQEVSKRPGDLAARYGGEEFALVFPETDFARLAELMHSLLERISIRGIPHATSGCSSNVTLSAGAVSMVPERQSGFEGALEMADRLLYDAKSNGRNHCALVDQGTQQKERVFFMPV